MILNAGIRRFNNSAGPELFVDPTFQNAPSWTQGGTKITVTGGALVIAALAVYNTDYVEQTISGLFVGAHYRLNIIAASLSGNLFEIDVVGVSTPVSIGAAGSATGFFTATATTHTLRLTAQTAPTGTITSVSFRRI